MNYNKIKAEDNVSVVTQFILLGFSDLPNVQGLLFALFFIIYMIILIGNSLIIIVTRLDTALQKPMYFFLTNFSSLEICFVSVTVPRILKNLWTQDRTISRLGCATQNCFFITLGASECFLLAVMSYDRYVAICNPLHYPLVMNHKMCVQLAVGAWVIGIPVQIGQTSLIFSLHFCNSNQIHHFFCDIPPLIKLACGDTSVPEKVLFVASTLFVAIPFTLILISYGKIISTILKLPTASGRAKAFSTCSSHLIVVVLFFGSASITYFRPKSNHSASTDKLLSLFYTVITPMFNPLIYSLRNKDVIAALRKMKGEEMKAEDNVSTVLVMQFVLWGFSDFPNLQGLLFALFFLIYMIILIGNSLTIIVTRLDTALQKPMYFFLANFSFLEICFVSVTVPRILKNLWTQDRSISKLKCATQIYFLHMLGTTECFLLVVMAYDRYVAICTILCTISVVLSVFCDSNQINHFFCDIPSMFKVACGDTSINELCVFIAAVLFVMIPFLLILGSYIKIISTILKLPSVTGRSKAFSTCSSHVIVVVLFFGSVAITYLKPKSNCSTGSDKMLSLLYTVVTPIFNPMIYSFRNKDVIVAVKKLLLKKT
ncbi:Olfactory receptor 10AG1, partial [Galemys pyrenaicus]